MRIIIHTDGSVVITQPWWARKRDAQDFLTQNHDWIAEKIESITAHLNPNLSTSSHDHYLQHKETARELVHRKLEYWGGYLNLTHNRVSIRNQRTRWGSCSSTGNLSFSYKIIFLPEHLQDYLIVHELCHLREMNHSARFWALVQGALPKYAELRKELNRATQTDAD